LSFAGEKRAFVARVAAILAGHFGEAGVLYDKFHVAEFARDDGAFYLPELYRDQSELIVAIVSPEYEGKEWTGLEWNGIFDLLKKRQHDRVMLYRFEKASVRGLQTGAIFIDLDDKTPEECAGLILQRLALNEGKDRDYYLHIERTPTPRAADAPGYKFDVALSFAQEDRDAARELGRILNAREVAVFYDEWGVNSLEGERLEEHIDELLRFRAHFGVLLATRNYDRSEWRKHHLTDALSRARQRDADRFLAIRLDDVELLGIPLGAEYLDLQNGRMGDAADAITRRIPRNAREEAHAVVPVEPVIDSHSRIENSNFTRKLASPRSIQDSELTSALLAAWPRVPAFERAKIAAEAGRILGHREAWANQDELADFSYPYTAWRTDEAVFVSTLPGPIWRPQKTMEFAIVSAPTPRLMLRAVWEPCADEWRGWNVDEYHRLFADLWADRSGVSMSREAIIWFARQKGYTFAPPVVPYLGIDEALCGWTHRSVEKDWFDWDRDPRLTGPGTACEETYRHEPSKAALHVLTVQGGWRNAALFEFHNTLSTLLPHRYVNTLLTAGSMRVALFLWTGGRPTDTGYAAFARLQLAMLRMLAAERDWPLTASDSVRRLPTPTGEELRAFTAALEAFGEKQFVDCPREDDWNSVRDKDEFVRLRRLFLPFPSLEHGFWGSSKTEIIEAIAQMERHAGPTSDEG